MKKILLILSLALTFTISATYDGFDDGFSSTTQGFGDDCNDPFSTFTNQCESDPYSNEVISIPTREGTLYQCTRGPCQLIRVGRTFQICDTGDNKCTPPIVIPEGGDISSPSENEFYLSHPGSDREDRCIWGCENSIY